MTANANIKNAIYVAVALSVAVPVLHYAPDYIQFHQHMVNLGIDQDTICDSACADRVMDDDEGRRYEQGYACVEISPDSYVCRPPRGADDILKEGYQIMQAAIHNGPYGEIFVVPTDGTDRGTYHVGAVLLTDGYLDKIRVNFHDYDTGGRDGIVHEYAADEQGGIVHVADMVPGDTYVECNPYRQNVFHLVEYTGTFDLNGTRMAEFWAAHIWPQPPELSPCDAKKTISRSLRIDYDLGLPPYEEFERVFMEKQQRGDNLGP